MSNLKRQLHDLCQQYIRNSIIEIEAAIADRRDAISNETKSSMGDKYETTREMLQQDINMNLDRLNKVKADETVLKSINPEMVFSSIMPGSVIHTNNGDFYLAISAGNFTIGGKKYFAISPSSPIGMQLKGKQAGDSFRLNDKDYIIEQVL